MSRVLLLFFATLIGATGVALAQEPDTSRPPEPTTEWDWVKLTSGEWLGGELKGLRDQSFEFDSDKLGLLNLDWEDVAELRSATVRTYRFEDIAVVAGTGVMRDGEVLVRTDEGVQTFPQASLILIIEGEGSELDYWSSKASVGLVARSGNTDQADFNASVRVRRQSPRLRSELNYTGNVGKLEGKENINNNVVDVNIDALLSAGFFVTLGTVNFFQDKFQNIDRRVTVGAGLGYDIIRSSDVTWKVALTGGYQTTSYISVQEDVSDSDDTFSLTPSTGLEADLTSDVTLTFDYEANVAVPDVEKAFHHAAGTIAVDIWGDTVDLNFSLTWDRVETPRENAEGIRPERDDFRTTFGFSVAL